MVKDEQGALHKLPASARGALMGFPPQHTLKLDRELFWRAWMPRFQTWSWSLRWTWISNCFLLVFIFEMGWNIPNPTLSVLLSAGWAQAPTAACRTHGRKCARAPKTEPERDDAACEGTPCVLFSTTLALSFAVFFGWGLGERLLFSKSSTSLKQQRSGKFAWRNLTACRNESFAMNHLEGRQTGLNKNSKHHSTETDIHNCLPSSFWGFIMLSQALPGAQSNSNPYLAHSRPMGNKGQAKLLYWRSYQSQDKFPAATSCAQLLNGSVRAVHTCEQTVKQHLGFLQLRLNLFCSKKPP